MPVQSVCSAVVVELIGLGIVIKGRLQGCDISRDFIDDKELVMMSLLDF